MSHSSTAIVILGPSARETANTIKAALPDSTIHGLSKRIDDVDLAFDDTIQHLQDLFKSGKTIIGLCASGILIRALGPVLMDKTAESPVLAVSEDGASIIPLLGGHHGANDLAKKLAVPLGGHPAITTAGDLRAGIALDNPPPGWNVDNFDVARATMADIIAGKPLSLTVEAGNADWLKASDIVFNDKAERPVILTERVVSLNDSGGLAPLVYNPPVLTIGVGCERGVTANELIALVDKTVDKAGLAKGAVAAVVSIDLKADEACIHALADYFGVPARFFPAETLERETPRLANPSDIVFDEVGCHGVAEGAALAAAGPDARLIVEKTKSERATCAIAKAQQPLNPKGLGRKQGRLFVVGIGPGSDVWRSPEATEALTLSEEVVGYKLYLDLVSSLIDGKTRHMSELAEEEARARKALDLAAEGKDISLVCSGDAGIYALATLVMELLDRENRPDWNRLAIQVCPGISAFQAAAARAGAPIGHDFCTVSLSDLLTPWEEIERRLKAAAEGDFIVSFYNPVSQRRRTQLARAQEILMEHRPAKTPVILARNLGRAEEKIDFITLEELTPDHADMLTLVMVGNSQTRLTTRGIHKWAYTPRGYAAKMKAPGAA